jgi:hypothetical protein
MAIKQNILLNLETPSKYNSYLYAENESFLRIKRNKYLDSWGIGCKQKSSSWREVAFPSMGKE